MKTTIDLGDSLAASLKARAARDGISMRAAVHEALRLWLKAEPEVPHRISSDIGLMTGKGLTAEASSASWDELRALSYDEKI